jgi:hypothetical protein
MLLILIYRSNCCKQAITLIENWPVRVNECNRDISTTIL